MKAIFKREFSSYFNSASGYVFLAVFYFFAGFYFFSNNLMQNSSDISMVFQSLFTIFIFLVPILTMRLFSEEFNNRTDQLLLTSPVRLNGIVYGKFFAAFAVYLIGVAILAIYMIVISFFVSVSVGEALCYMLGILLLGGAMISIGIFLSSLTKSQIIAAVCSFGVFLLLMYIDIFAEFVPTQILRTFLSDISLIDHYSDFMSAIFNVSDLLYFLSVIFVFNFLTVRVLEKKRWGV